MHLKVTKVEKQWHKILADFQGAIFWMCIINLLRIVNRHHHQASDNLVIINKLDIAKNRKNCIVLIILDNDMV